MELKEVVSHAELDAIAYFKSGEIVFLPDAYGSDCKLLRPGASEAEEIDEESPWVQAAGVMPTRDGFTQEEIELWNKHMPDYEIEVE